MCEWIKLDEEGRGPIINIIVIVVVKLFRKKPSPCDLKWVMITINQNCNNCKINPNYALLNVQLRLPT
jgi:hypothetical protein